MDEAEQKVKMIIENNPHIIPGVLKICAREMDNFRHEARLANDSLLREALGDAVHLLGMKRKPDKDQMSNFCARIKKAIFPKGITEYHHMGEKNFFAKYLQE